MSPATSETRVIAGRYRIVRPLGAGAHGVVELAEDLLNGGRHVAVKRLEGLLGAGDPEPAAERLRWFQHPHWAEILDEGRLPEHGRFQVMRYVPGASLESQATGLPADEVWRLLEDGARVLRALHLRGLIHYDVTPGNILREEGPEGVLFTLTDGGLASLGPVKGIARGAPAFMAPELLEGVAHDHRVDLYSLGLVAFRMAAGRDPVTGGAGEVLGRRRREAAPLARSLNPSVPEALEKVLAWLLDRDPARRPQDADALLVRLAALGHRHRPQITDDEAAAIAAGGRLVGREPILARFRSACRALVDAPEAGGPFLAPGAAPAAPKVTGRDAVLVIQGPQGSGGTRLLRELQATARADGIAVLSLSGRDSAAERRSVIRRLADGVSRLAGDLDSDDGAARSDARADRDDADATGGDAAAARAIERFIELCERTSRKSPVVLLVEDFSELAPPTQEALRVLSRHLISRVEHPDGRPAPGVLLVVEHGPDDPDGFLIPDAAQARRPIVALPPLALAEVKALLADRFPTLEPVEPDAEAVRAQTEGSPSAVVSCLAQAYLRGDLRTDTGRFSWDLARLGTYRYERALSAETRRALESSSPVVRSTLEQLALLEAPAPEALAAALCGATGVGSLPESRLVSVSREGGQVRLALAGRAVRDAVLEGLDDARRDELRKGLLRAMARTPLPELAAEEARLWVDASDPERALRVLSQGKAALPAAARARAQIVGTRIAAKHPDLLASPAHRTVLASTLLPGPDAKALVAALVSSFPAVFDAEDLRGACLVADHLFQTRQFPASDAFAARAENLETAPPDLEPRLVELRILRARSKLAMNHLAAAKTLLTQCASALRRLGRTVRARELRLLAAYWLARGRALTAETRSARAIGMNRMSARASRHDHDVRMLAQALNNLAVALQHTGETREAERVLSRALRLRLAAGDVQGAAGLLQNLGRMAQFRGALLESAALYTKAAALGSRFAHHEGLVLALAHLADIYDRQGNSALAIGSLIRARAVGVHTRDLENQAAVAQRLGELQASTVLTDGYRTLFAESCAKLRQGPRGLGRNAHYLLRLCAELVRGDHSRAPVLDRRAGRTPSVARIFGLRSAMRTHLHLSGSANLRRDTSEAPTAGDRKLFQATRQLQALAASFSRRSTRIGASLVLEALEGRYLPDISPLPGPLLRVWLSMLIEACHCRGLNDNDALRVLAGVASLSSRRGYTTLEVRALAARTDGLREKGLSAEAGTALGRAAGLLDAACETSDATASLRSRPVAVLPELRTCLMRVSGTPAIDASSRPLAECATLAHAAAHRMGLPLGASTSPDNRRQSAMRTILDVAARLQTTAGLEVLLESLNEYAREITRAERTCIVLTSASSERLIRVASSSISPDVRARLEVVSQTVIRRVITSRTPLLLHDVFGDSELMARPSVLSLSLRSVLCVPMLRGGDLFGVMYADSSVGAGSFDAVDLEILSLFAEQAAAAIETSRLLADVQKSYSELKSAQERLLRGERLRVMGEMTSGVAHEFNNLLTAILARIQLMNLSYIAPDVKDDLALIEKAALDAAGVVRRLQGFTRSQRQAAFQQVDMAEVCADVVELLRPLWSSRRRGNKAAIAVRLRASGACWVAGDPTELREVLTNLLKNSLDAVDSGGEVVISVVCRGGRVRTQVTDDGGGIPKDLLAKVFTPFFTTKGDKGTGLGLCLAQQIVERHGGELALASEVGHGTTATVELPEATSAPSLAAQSATSGVRASPPCEIIIVDDDPNVLSPLCSYLQRSGFNIRGVGSASDALAQTKTQEPDLVISDISMPEMDGIELCRRLKAVSPKLPVVLMSGQASAIDPARVRDAGASALLAKPFTMRQVLDLVASLAQAPRDRSQ